MGAAKVFAIAPEVPPSTKSRMSFEVLFPPVDGVELEEPCAISLNISIRQLGLYNI